MPLVKKSCSLVSKHHPYLIDQIANEKLQNKKEQKHELHCSRNSFSDHGFIPRSVSVGEEAGSSWKLSLCGVLSSSFQEDDKHSDSFEQSVASYYSKSSILKSNDCQVSKNEDKPRSLTSPIAVPIRKGSRKRKSNFRSSGGYFFDKYMKRFQEKYSSQRPLCHSETIDELKVSQFNDETKTEVMKFQMRSNREDLVCCHPMLQKADCQEFCCKSFQQPTSDDLYPLRFGSSSKWSSQVFNSTHNSAAGNYDFSEGINSSSVFPSSPPCLWGDASCNEWDEIYAQPVSPVPSVSDAVEGSCRYSDSNSETLKAMETLYLCNFKVTVDGDWLCLKEIGEESLAPPSLVAYSLKGLPVLLCFF